MKGAIVENVPTNSEPAEFWCSDFIEWRGEEGGLCSENMDHLGRGYSDFMSRIYTSKRSNTEHVHKLSGCLESVKDVT